MFRHHCCYSEHNYCHGFYGALVCIGSFLAPFLLFALRVFFGVILLFAGLSKLSDAKPTAEFFANVGIPMSLFMAYVVGLLEVICGAALAVGFASRLIAIPIMIIMGVAYATAHHGAIAAFMMDPTLILVEKPFGFFLTALLVFCFGPGVISLDYLIERFVCKDRCTHD